MHLALACYRFIPLADPEKERARHLAFFKERGCTGRIYISRQGINVQVSGPEEAMKAYQLWLTEDERFKGMIFNTQFCEENIFPRMTVKIREQLVAFDREVDLEKRGDYLSPEAFAEALESEGDKLVIDVRNQYESKIGHFEGAHLPPLQLFREFPGYIAKLKERYDPSKTAVLMYCTGGIRCELFSALMKREGFSQVSQLQGGILNYGARVGSKLWKGKLFVFDDRLAIPIDERKGAPAISHCHYCREECDTYFNCANMQCNTLFLSCKSCLEQAVGCCSRSCQLVGALRPFDAREANKPFRRKHLWKQLSGCSVGESA